MYSFIYMMTSKIFTAVFLAETKDSQDEHRERYTCTDTHIITGNSYSKTKKSLLGRTQGLEISGKEERNYILQDSWITYKI